MIAFAYYGLTVPLLALLVFGFLFSDSISGFFNGGGKRQAGDPVQSNTWPTLAELAASDASDDAPTITVLAPIEQGCRNTPTAAAETVRDLAPAGLIRNAADERMYAELYGSKPPSAAELTQPLAAGVLPLWQASSSPTEVSRQAAETAVEPVAEHLAEAS